MLKLVEKQSLNIVYLHLFCIMKNIETISWKYCNKIIINN